MFTSKIKLNVLNLNFLPKNDQKRVQNHQKSRNSGRSNDLISRKSWNFPKIARDNFEINQNRVPSIEISLFLIEKSSIDHDCIQKSCSIKPDSNNFFDQSEWEYVYFVKMAISSKKLFWKNNALFLYNQNLIFKILIGKLNYMDTLVLPLNKID